MQNPLATTHPTVADATWTQVTKLPGRNVNSNIQERHSVLVRSEEDSGGTNWRIESSLTQPVGATAGQRLEPGDVYVEDAETTTQGHIWAYQASGGALATLAVTESRNA